MNADQFALSDFGRSDLGGRASSGSASRDVGLDQNDMERVLEEFCFLSQDPIGTLSEVAREMRGLKHAVWALVGLLILMGLAASQLA